MSDERLQDDAAAIVIPRPPFAGPLGRFAAAIYGKIIQRRNRRFDAGHGVVTLDRPVISVGNLSVGGTGKTPMVERVCRWLIEAGHRPAIAMRGYRAANGSSDEALIYENALPSVAVVAQADRVGGLLQLFATEAGEAIDCVVLDDGFQHRRIARQCEIVLVDSTRDPLADRLLPAGWLREHVASLARADAVVITHAECRSRAAVVTLESKLWDVSRNFITSAMRHHWASLLRGGTDERIEKTSLRGRPYMLACAIGNPNAFISEATRVLGAAPAESMVLRDHDPFAPATIARLIERLKASQAAALLVTEKDWTKLRAVRADQWPCPVFRPQLDLKFDRGEDTLRDLILARVAAGVPDDE